MHAPIITLTSVERLDDDGNVIDTYDGCYVYGDGESGLIFRRSGFGLGGTFDPVIDPRTVYAPTPNRLRVTYTGGYITPGQVEADNSLVSTTPPDLQEAVIREVTNAFRNRGRDRDADSKTTVDATITYRQGGGLLKSTQDLLKTYWLQPI
jgi:hypothetical protein